MLSSNSLIFTLLVAVPGLYLLGTVLAYISRENNRFSSIFATLISFSSLLASLFLIQLSYQHSPLVFNIPWFELQDLGVFTSIEFQLGFLIDPLSLLLLFLISAISPLVFLYSNWYLKSINQPGHYWWKLLLFCGAMQTLVLSSNLLQLFMAWELVGFSSYLLINFYRSKQEANRASFFAFMNNKVGDLFFLAALILLWAQFRTLDILELGLLAQDGIGKLQSSSLSQGQWVSTLIGNEGGLFLSLPAWSLSVTGLLFCLGAFAKSAQFPLSAWLPRAMIAPTPISSLIHAATMVAAGVFLIARVYPLLTPPVLAFVAISGSLTALLFAISACFQQDIKKVLAHSTISQLGFMIAALGVSGYSESLIHLSSHAFFKCLLFLSAGSIIVHFKWYLRKNKWNANPQELGNLKGIGKNLHFTKIAFIVGAACLIGLPLTSGYLSKEAILQALSTQAHQSDTLLNLVVAIFSFIAIYFSAYYISRLYFLLFTDRASKQHPKEQLQWTWGLPVLVLMVFCFFPVVSLHPFSLHNSYLMHFLLRPDAIFAKPILVTGTSVISDWIIPSISILFSGIAIFHAYLNTGRKNPSIRTQHPLFKNWGLDILYRFISKALAYYPAKLFSWLDIVVLESINKSMVILQKILSFLSKISDRFFIDGLVHLSVKSIQISGKSLVTGQKGSIQYYILLMIVALILIFVFI